MIAFLHLLCLLCIASPAVKIGDCEKVFTLDQKNLKIRGLAFDAISPKSPRLFILDQSGKISVYRVGNQLIPIETFKPPCNPPASPRGLAFALENNKPVFYLLNWTKKSSQLWRWRKEDNSVTIKDLSHHHYRIGDREVFDLTFTRGKILICYDASGYKDPNLRVMRGIIQISKNSVKHLPDSGEFVSRGIAAMEMDGSHYLFASADNDYIYAADGATGRGLFYFDWPHEGQNKSKAFGLCYGDGAVWGSDKNRIFRINVTKNPNTVIEGPRNLRKLIMTINSKPEKPTDHPGKVFHNYSRPYAYEQLGNQGTWPETEVVRDLTNAPNAKVGNFSYDPGKDASCRQEMRVVEYANAPAKAYTSKYEIDIWTNRCRKYVYPHRVNTKKQALTGTDYLADDPDLFNLSDKRTYSGFFKRVQDHISNKYDVHPKMEHPYWATRNALEYIQDHYYYPCRPKGKPAAVDYHNHHFDANPGNLKIKLSEKKYDKSQIIACSGTSVMMAGAMRYIGIPSRWLGTGTQSQPTGWDKNKNRLLDEKESAPCSNGHRYTQVWLGENYGWTCFDATPSRPNLNDYDTPPTYQSQWRYMSRAAAGHMRDRRIVFNVGDRLFKPLYREFEYDEELANNNDCGGDQRYNLQGRFEKPELWKLPKHRIHLENLCFITNVAFSGPKGKTMVTWDLKGKWDKAPEALLDLYLVGKNTDLLVSSLPYDAKKCMVDLTSYSGKGYYLILRKAGDSETGGQSELFNL